MPSGRSTCTDHKPTSGGKQMPASWGGPLALYTLLPLQKPIIQPGYKPTADKTVDKAVDGPHHGSAEASDSEPWVYPSHHRQEINGESFKDVEIQDNRDEDASCPEHTGRHGECFRIKFHKSRFSITST